MIDLDALSQIDQRKQITGNLYAAKHNNAEGYYYLGLMALSLAQKSKFQDKDLALKASRFLLKAVQLNRRFPDPYVALGYLMLVYQRPARAARYLLEALERAPDHTEAKKLLALARGESYPEQQFGEIQTLLKKIQTQSQSSFEVYQGVKSLEALVKKLKDHTDELQTWLNKAIPSSEVDDLEALDARLGELEALQHLLSYALNQTKDPLQRSRLQLCQGALISHGKKLKQVMSTSETLVELHDEIDILLEKAELLQEQLRSQSINPEGSLSQTLDNWFNQCDQFADQLEGLEGKNYAIQGLLKDYDKLTQILSELDQRISQLK